LKTKPDLFRPRLSKVLTDLWGDKTRTALVVASIAVGVFAVGMIITAYKILSEDINHTYASANPVNIDIWTDPFHEDFVRVIEKTPGVKDVEGRHIFSIRARRGGENWQGLSLVGVSDFSESVINKLTVIEGSRFPGRDEVILSEDLINSTGYHVGDEIEVELPDGTKHSWRVVGLISDQTSAKPEANITSNAFVTIDTIRTTGLGDHFNRLFVTVDGPGGSEKFISIIADNVEDKVEGNGKQVFRTKESLSNEHPMSDTLLAIIGVLGALGILITILSVSLIINMLNALLTQQLRQIGVMKLIGGSSLQILGMYLTLIATYSFMALFIAVPLGVMAGYGLASFITRLMAGSLQGFRIIPIAIVAQVLIAYLIPLGAGFFPVYKGSKTNVRRAINNYRPNVQAVGRSLLNWGSRLFSWIPRPILLSFRNTFRKKGRLILTIFTLTVSGAVFIAVFNVRASMDNVLDQLMQHFMGDITVNFTRPYKTSKVERDLLVLPGIIGIEAWGGTNAEILDDNGESVTELAIVAPPQDTKLLKPEFVAGRWLHPDEKKAMVVSDTIYNYYPELQPGDQLIVEISGDTEEKWEVVGVYSYLGMFDEPLAYANYDYIADKVKMPMQATSFRVITEELDTTSLDALIAGIDRQLADRGYEVQGIEAGYLMRESASVAVNTVILFLLIMALLTAIVGSIGLTGTMSINVLERTREIGVMRAIGAVDLAIMQSVIIEGLVIGLITWVLAIGLAYPISSALLGIIGQTMAGSTLTLIITPLGMFLWLGIVFVLSIIASIMPARNAARLTINEVLAYE